MTVERGDSRNRANGDRVIAAENDRQFPSLKSLLHALRQLYADRPDLVEVSELFAMRGRVSRAFEAQVAEVAHFVAKLRDSLSQSGDAHRRRAEVNACDARAVAARRADDADPTPFAGFSCRRLRLRLFFENSAHAKKCSEEFIISSDGKRGES